MKGIDTKIDNLGRILIPVQYRRELKLEAESRLKISVKDGSIVITPSEESCLICGSKIDINADLSLCSACIHKIKST